MTESLLNTFKACEQKYGPWVSHNIEYAPGLFTRSETAPIFPGHMAVQAAQWLGRFLRKPWADNTILDLGCLEGGRNKRRSHALSERT